MPAASPELRNAAESTHVIFGDQDAFAATINTTALDAASGFNIDGKTAGDASGISFARAGDMNGDGIGDMVIGAVGSGLGGAAYVVFGNASGLSDMTLDALDGADGFRIYGITSGDGTGFAVSTAGDFNGDGFAHIIVGSESATSGGLSGRGEAHIVFGKSSGFASSIDLGNLGDAEKKPY